jgi:hypothetical protein
LLDERETWTYSTVSYGELYLELETIDLNSDDAIKDFVVRHHVMGVYQDRPEWRGIEGDPGRIRGLPGATASASSPAT